MPRAPLRYGFPGLVLERARIGGLLVPSFCPGDEFDGDDEGDGEGDLGEALVGVAVGVAS